MTLPLFGAKPSPRIVLTGESHTRGNVPETGIAEKPGSRILTSAIGEFYADLSRFASLFHPLNDSHDPLLGIRPITVSGFA